MTFTHLTTHPQKEGTPTTVLWQRAQMTEKQQQGVLKQSSLLVTSKNIY